MRNAPAPPPKQRRRRGSARSKHDRGRHNTAVGHVPAPPEQSSLRPKGPRARGPRCGPSSRFGSAAPADRETPHVCPLEPPVVRAAAQRQRAACAAGGLSREQTHAGAVGSSKRHGCAGSPAVHGASAVATRRRATSDAPMYPGAGGAGCRTTPDGRTPAIGGACHPTGKMMYPGGWRRVHGVARGRTSPAAHSRSPLLDFPVCVCVWGGWEPPVTDSGPTGCGSQAPPPNP